MALKRQIAKDEYEKLADPLKTEYKASGDVFILDVEGIDDITNVESALKKTREELKAVKSAQERFKDVDPERYKKLLAEQEQLEAKKLEQEGDYKAALAQVNDKHAKAIEAKDKELAKMQANLEKRLVDADVTAAIASHGGNQDLLFDLVKKRTKAELADSGDYIVKVLGEDGKPLVDSKGEALTIAGMVEQMKGDKRYGGAFAARPASGGGQHGDRKPSPTTPAPAGDAHGRDKIAAGLKKLPQFSA